MASDFLADADAPVYVTLADGGVCLPVLTTGELKALGAKVKALKIEAFKLAAIEMKLSPTEAAYMVGKEASSPIGPDSILVYANTLDGCEDVIDASIKAGKVDDATAKKIKALPLDTRVSLAVELCGILEAPRRFVRKDEKKAEAPTNGSDLSTAAQAT